MTYNPLKLLVTDAKDLLVISRCLQDGLLSLSSISHGATNKRLTCLINRFCWETLANDNLNREEDHQEEYYRVHTGLCIHNVQSVHLKGIKQTSTERMSNILCLKLDDDASHLHLVCSGDHEIKVAIDKLYVQFADLDEPWLTSKKPTHYYDY